MKPGARSSWQWLLVAAVSTLFLAQQFGRETSLFTNVLGPHVIRPIAALLKLACQLAGCVYAARCVRAYEPGTRVRTAWLLMSVWFGAYFMGQLGLTWYDVLTETTAPLPSVGDYFFLLGYACVIPALVLFVTAYRASGFATGQLREHLPVVLVACAVFAFFSHRVLLPIAMAATPLGERLINVGYPVLDLLLLIPALMLLRITRRFQGGRVWTVWAALLAGILCTATADMLFADVSDEHLKAVGPLVDLLYILSYMASAVGARAQFRLVTE